MNLVDCYVTKIIEAPYYAFNYWWQKVECDCWGSVSTSLIMKKQKEEIDKIKVGYKFQS